MKRLILIVAITTVWGFVYVPPVLGQAKPDIGLRTLDIKEPERELGLIWHSTIVPGEEVVMVKVTLTRYQSTFYGRYRFGGVVGNSLKIDKTGASHSSERWPGQSTAWRW